jgi:transposase InsO family protein
MRSLKVSDRRRTRSEDFSTLRIADDTTGETSDIRRWDVLVAADFFSIEAWTRKGLTRYIVLFLMDLSTRRVHIGGIASRANGLWMTQVARNVTDDVDGFLRRKRYLIHDRDPLYTDEFLRILRDAGVESVKLPPQSPNLNAHAERFVRTIKESCLERMILFLSQPSSGTAARPSHAC